MLNEFNNDINELKNDYLTGQDEEIDDIIENASIVYNCQLNFFNKHIEKHKPGLSSIQFSSQNTIAERVKLRRQKADDEDLSDMSSLGGKGLKILTRNKLLTRLPILPAQIKSGKDSHKLKNKIR